MPKMKKYYRLIGKNKRYNIIVEAESKSDAVRRFSLMFPDEVFPEVIIAVELK